VTDETGASDAAAGTDAAVMTDAAVVTDVAGASDAEAATDAAQVDAGCAKGTVWSPTKNACVPGCGSSNLLCADVATCINSVCTCPKTHTGNGSWCCLPGEKYDPPSKTCIPPVTDTVSGSDASDSSGATDAIGETDGQGAGDTVDAVDAGCAKGTVWSPTKGTCVPGCGGSNLLCADIASCINSICTCPKTHTGNGIWCCLPAEKYDPSTKTCIPPVTDTVSGDTSDTSSGNDTADTTTGTDAVAATDATTSDVQLCGGQVCGINSTCISDKCTCNSGFAPSNGTTTCLDINECLDPAKIGCEGTCVNSNGSYQCFGKGGISSIEDPNTPYPETQCAGSVGPEAIWFQTHKTTFPVDCRCPPGSGQPGAKFCAAPFGTATGGVKIGTGVAPADHTSANIQGCATNYTAKTVYFGVTWGNNLDNTRGYIMAVDPVTGNRTVISGDYFSPADGVVTVGTGNKFDLIKDLALGPDGLLYVFEDSVPGSTFAPDDTNPDLQGRSVYSVDLTTGNRTLIWNHQTWNHPEFVGCSNGQPVAGNPLKTTDIQLHGFELFENGDFLFATNGNVNPSEGEGFIRVGKDGKSCTWITRSSTKSGNLLFGVTEGAGSGVEVAAGFDSGFGYKDGFIYATAFLTGSLYKVEVATGKRSMIWNKMQPTVGTGPGPGVWQFFYYPHFGLWVAGGNELGTPSNASLFDPASGDTWGWMYKKPDGSIQGSGSEMGGGNDAYNGPVGIQTNQLRGPILGAKYETLSDRPWCISPVAPNRLLVATDSVGVVIVEVETGNTMNLSL
jgi:hypothetical protein